MRTRLSAVCFRPAPRAEAWYCGGRLSMIWLNCSEVILVSPTVRITFSGGTGGKSGGFAEVAVTAGCGADDGGGTVTFGGGVCARRSAHGHRKSNVRKTISS